LAQARPPLPPPITSKSKCLDEEEEEAAAGACVDEQKDEDERTGSEAPAARAPRRAIKRDENISIAFKGGHRY